MSFGNFLFCHQLHLHLEADRSKHLFHTGSLCVAFAALGCCFPAVSDQYPRCNYQWTGTPARALEVQLLEWHVQRISVWRNLGHCEDMCRIVNAGNTHATHYASGNIFTIGLVNVLLSACLYSSRNFPQRFSMPYRNSSSRWLIIIITAANWAYPRAYVTLQSWDAVFPTRHILNNSGS